jgi:hypothetical protein
MNDIFKFFRKKAQSSPKKGITVLEIIKDLSEKEQDEIMESNRFERGQKSYLSISKSGRMKSKRAHHTNNRAQDLFNTTNNTLISNTNQNLDKATIEINNHDASSTDSSSSF